MVVGFVVVVTFLVVVSFLVCLIVVELDCTDLAFVFVGVSFSALPVFFFGEVEVFLLLAFVESDGFCSFSLATDFPFEVSSDF